MIRPLPPLQRASSPPTPSAAKSSTPPGPRARPRRPDGLEDRGPAESSSRGRGLQPAVAAAHSCPAEVKDTFSDLSGALLRVRWFTPHLDSQLRSQLAASTLHAQQGLLDGPGRCEMMLMLLFDEEGENEHEEEQT